MIEELTNTVGLAPAAKTVYVAAMMHQPGTLQSLAVRLGLDRKSVARHCKELESLGWLQIIGEGKASRPVAIVPKEVEAKIATETRELINLKPFQGEETTKAFVAWIISPAVRLLFNVRPPFLRNRATGQNLECDISAPDYSWVGEYQGVQHFGPTDQYNGDKEFIERFRRDRLKVELCRQHAVRLSHVTKQDLTLKKMLEAIPEDIPRRTFDPSGPYIKMLEQLGRRIAEGRDWDKD